MLFERCEGRWFTEKGLQEKKWKLNFPIDRNFSSHEKEFRLTKYSPVTRNNPDKGLSAYSFSKSRREIAIILQNLFLSLDHRSFTPLNGWNFETLNPDGNRIHRAKNDPRNAYVYVLLLDRSNDLWCESYRSGGSIETRKTETEKLGWGGEGKE